MYNVPILTSQFYYLEPPNGLEPITASLRMRCSAKIELRWHYDLVRVARIELASRPWQGRIISLYTIPAKSFFDKIFIVTPF
jgi:hypothetical protein